MFLRTDAERHAAPAAGESALACPSDAQATYTVAPGDSAIKIARRFGIDEDALLQANDLGDPNRAYAGQVLTIPELS